MVVERALDLVPVAVSLDTQRVRDMDALDHEDTVVALDLTARLAREPAFVWIDVTRFQRASEGAGESAGSRGDDVVERRRALGIAAPRNAVVVGDLVVNSEEDRFFASGKLRASQWAADSLDPHVRGVDDICHCASLPGLGGRGTLCP